MQVISMAAEQIYAGIVRPVTQQHVIDSVYNFATRIWLEIEV